jgi:hypothetical protein
VEPEAHHDPRIPVHDSEVSAKLDAVLAKLDDVITVFQQEEEQVSLDLSALTAAVQSDTDATSSAVTLIQTLASEITNVAGDQTAVNDLATQISSAAQSLAAAVTANTPAAPPAPTV